MKEYDLKTREFISNTSMDPLLSLIMGNMGLAKSGSIVFDPFVGSGKFLWFKGLSIVIFHLKNRLIG